MKKYFLYILSSIIIFIFSLIIYFSLFFDPNDYREQITQYLSSKTGLHILYNGDIEIKYLPESTIMIPNLEIFEKNNSGLKKIVSIEELKMVVATDKLKDSIIDVKSIMAKNLYYYGVNIDETLIKTYSLIKSAKFSFTSDNVTHVKVLSSSAIINNNIMEINRIYIETDLLKAEGEGKLFLSNKTVNFLMTGSILNKNIVSSKYINDYPEELMGEKLPINIDGHVDNLSISININSILMKKINPIKDTITNKIKEKIIDELKDKIKLPF